MRTSDVKVISEIKEWGDGDRKTFYHNLEMENGDKINIGKKKPLQVGDNINYEIIGDEGQHEYTKAKSVNPQFEANKGANVKGIEVGHAVNNAVNMICAGIELDLSQEPRNTEHKIYMYAEKVLAISDELKSRR